MQDYFNSPIFVLGLPRSGTSMIAGCLNLCGAWTGSTVSGPGKENAKGFYEHRVIRENIIKQILKDMGCDPLGVTSLPALDAELNIADLADTIDKLVREDGYGHDRPWLYKDAKLTLLWPAFSKVFPAAKWVIVRRDDASIIKSCLRTIFMKQHSTDPLYWKHYVDEYMARIDALKRSGLNYHEIWPQQLIDGNLESIQCLVSRLGLTYRESELVKFITPGHWHGRANTRNGSESMGHVE